MMNTEAHKPLSAAAISSAVAPGALSAKAGAPRMLSPAAAALAAESVSAAISPIVIEGVVRALESALIGFVGMLVYAFYVAPSYDLMWQYLAAVAVVTTIALFVFQAADLYQIGAFRRPGRSFTRLMSAWSLVFLIAMGLSFFAKLDVTLSRVWLTSFYGCGLVALIALRAGVYMLVRHWARAGRLTRRTVIVGGGESGGDADRRPAGAGRQRRAHRRPVRRSQRRALAADLRRPLQARHRRRSRRIRAAHAHRSRDLLAADLRRKPHPCRC